MDDGGCDPGFAGMWIGVCVAAGAAGGGGGPDAGAENGIKQLSVVSDQLSVSARDSWCPTHFTMKL